MLIIAQIINSQHNTDQVRGEYTPISIFDESAFSATDRNSSPSETTLTTIAEHHTAYRKGIGATENESVLPALSPAHYYNRGRSHINAPD